MAETRKIGGSAGNRGKGRPKGAKNRTTVAFKEAMMAVYADLQGERADLGEHGHFLAWAKETPTEFYKLASKLLPLQVSGEGGGPVEISTVKLVGVRAD